MSGVIILPEDFHKSSGVQQPQTKEYGDDLDVNIFTQSQSSIAVSKAMQIEAVYSCIRDKAETVGRLPVYLYDKTNGVDRVEEGRLWKIFTQQPCDYMTTQGFLEFMTASLELNGAFYAYPYYNDRGSLMELIPFRHQANVTPSMDQYGRVYYHYVTNDGQPKLTFGMDELFVVKQFTLDGMTPVTPIQYNANSLNGAYDTEETHNKYQSNGITSQFALTTDKSVNPDAATRLKKDWNTFRGAPGVSNTPILEDGMDIKSLQLSPKDAELLQSREFSVNRICRIFRVPPERIGVAKTASSLTMLDIDEAYMRNGIEPVLMKYEAACNLLLLKLKVKKSVRFNRRAFYSGSPHRMVEAVSSEFKMGAITINEMRIDLGRDPVEGGDVYAIDTNNITLGLLTDIPALQEQIRLENKPTEGEEPKDEE